MMFRVTVFYREPLYAKYAGVEERQYRGSFVVSASGEDEAVKRALAEFREVQAQSSVSWSRVIDRWECLRL